MSGAKWRSNRRREQNDRAVAWDFRGNGETRRGLSPQCNCLTQACFRGGHLNSVIGSFIHLPSMSSDAVCNGTRMDSSAARIPTRVRQLLAPAVELESVLANLEVAAIAAATQQIPYRRHLALEHAAHGAGWGRDPQQHPCSDWLRPLVRSAAAVWNRASERGESGEGGEDHSDVWAGDLAKNLAALRRPQTLLASGLREISLDGADSSTFSAVNLSAATAAERLHIGPLYSRQFPR